LLRGEHRQFDLAIILNFTYTNVHSVTHVDDIAGITDVLGAHGRNVYQTIFSRQDVHKCAIRLDADDFSVVLFTHLHFVHHTLNELTGAQIDVEEDAETETGRVNISSTDQAQIDHAYKLVEGMMHEVQVGEEYDGKVVRIEAYGAFVNILPGKDGLVHVSAMGTEYVRDASDVVNMGDTVHVRVSEIQDDGKIKLTMLTPEQEAEAAQRRAERGGGDRGDRGDRGGFGGGYGGGDRPRRSFDRGGRGGDRGGRPPFRGGRGGFGGDRPRGRFGDRSRGSDRPRERFEDR
jgi:predicted RNA-binding protein with RPS1 domain